MLGRIARNASRFQFVSVAFFFYLIISLPVFIVLAYATDSNGPIYFNCILTIPYAYKRKKNCVTRMNLCFLSDFYRFICFPLSLSLLLLLPLLLLLLLLSPFFLSCHSRFRFFVYFFGGIFCRHSYFWLGLVFSTLNSTPISK